MVHMNDVEKDLARETRPISTKLAIGFVYVGYSFRYLYLLILIPFYGRVLGTAEYGRVVAAMSIFQVVWMLTEFGFPAIGSRDIAAASPNQRGELYRRHQRARAAVALLGLIAGIGGTYLSPVLREHPIYGVLATLNGLVAAFNLGWYFNGTLQFRTSVAFEVMSFAINLALILSLVRSASDGWIVMASLLASSVICTICAHGFVLRQLGHRPREYGGELRLIKDSSALFVHRGLVSLMGAASTYVISLFATASELGCYGAAERLISAGLSLMSPANQVLVGIVLQYAGDEASSARAFALVRKALIAMVGLGLCMLLGTELLGDFIVPLILGPAFVSSVPLVKTMALIFPFAAVNTVITGCVLIPFRFERFVPIVSGIASAITLGLIVALGVSFGGTGVAWARVVGDVLTVVFLIAVLRKVQLDSRIFGGWRLGLTSA